MDVWNTLRLLSLGTKLFITFELKVFRHEERETQSFYADCFYIVRFQPNQPAAPVAHKVAWPRPALNLDSRSEAGTRLSGFLKSQNRQPTGMTPFTSPCPISYLGLLLWHMWMTHSPRARVTTCVNACT